MMMTDLVECISQGDTLAAAMANIQGAKIAGMETAWEYSDEISLPSQF
jgi:predicted RNase H-like HicB family nuclease